MLRGFSKFYRSPDLTQKCKRDTVLAQHFHQQCLGCVDLKTVLSSQFLGDSLNVTEVHCSIFITELRGSEEYKCLSRWLKQK